MGPKFNSPNAPYRILVVDDDPAVRAMVMRVLVEEGYRTDAAANGAEALELAAESPFDLVLLDLNMPVKNGWDTFERLTAEHPMMAVIVITARANQLFTALGAGVGALLEKPLNFPELLRTIRELLVETPEARLARLTGRSADLHYVPGERQGIENKHEK